MFQTGKRFAGLTAAVALGACSSPPAATDPVALQTAWLAQTMRTHAVGYESFIWPPDKWAQPHVNTYASADWQFTATGGGAYQVKACSVGGFVCAVLQPTSTTAATVVSWSGNNGWLAVADLDASHADCSNNLFSENGGTKSASIAGGKFDLPITGRIRYAGANCIGKGPYNCSASAGLACSVVPAGGSGSLTPQTDEAAFQRFYQP